MSKKQPQCPLRSNPDKIWSIGFIYDDDEHGINLIKTEVALEN